MLSIGFNSFTSVCLVIETKEYYNARLATNIIIKIFTLIDKHFPTGSILWKAFNRNTIKAPYRTYFEKHEGRSIEWFKIKPRERHQ